MEDGGAEGGDWDGLPPEILDVIFEHLPIQDLLSCSIISKTWKKAARDVLKRNRECYAHVKNFDEDIQDLNEMIAETDIMQMINGLHIRNEKGPKEERGSDSLLWQDFDCMRCSDVARILQSEETGRKLDEAKKKILGVLSGQWRYLDLDMGYELGHVVSRDKASLLREITLATSDSLQKLVVGGEDDWKFIPCCTKPFLKLKVIQVRQQQDNLCCFGNSLENFSPNLEKITGAMMRLDVRWPEDRFELERMKSFRVSPDLAAPHVEAREIFGCVSGLYRLDLQQYHCEPYNDDEEEQDDDEEEQDLASWHSIVFPFVLRSLNTLEELCMYTLELHNLTMVSDGLKFPNLRRLSLATHWNVSMDNEISALKNLKLPILCPNLEQLELMAAHCSHDVEDDVVPGGEPDGLDQSEMSVAVDLNCCLGLYNHEHLEFLQTVYPKLSKVRILKLRNVVDYEMSKIWEVQSLQYLEIQVVCEIEIELVIEALLCGINVEEAKLQLLENQKKKDKLNSCIVPIRPSLLNASNLKELKITEEPLNCENLVRRSWVTEITENLPERHVRHMTVTFDGTKGFYDRLSHMRTFTWLRSNKTRDKFIQASH